MNQSCPDILEKREGGKKSYSESSFNVYLIDVLFIGLVLLYLCAALIHGWEGERYRLRSITRQLRSPVSCWITDPFPGPQLGSKTAFTLDQMYTTYHVVPSGQEKKGLRYASSISKFDQKTLATVHTRVLTEPLLLLSDSEESAFRRSVSFSLPSLTVRFWFQMARIRNTDVWWCEIYEQGLPRPGS